MPYEGNRIQGYEFDYTGDVAFHISLEGDPAGYKKIATIKILQNLQMF